MPRAFLNGLRATLKTHLFIYYYYFLNTAHGHRHKTFLFNFCFLWRRLDKHEFTHRLLDIYGGQFVFYCFDDPFFLFVVGRDASHHGWHFLWSLYYLMRISLFLKLISFHYTFSNKNGKDTTTVLSLLRDFQTWPSCRLTIVSSPQKIGDIKRRLGTSLLHIRYIFSYYGRIDWRTDWHRPGRVRRDFSMSTFSFKKRTTKQKT